MTLASVLHANLGELYLHDMGHVPLALLHNTKSCLVGLKLWGASHPNVERKLREPLLQFDLDEWQREEDSAALDYASRRWPPPEAVTVVDPNEGD
ncbi:hypothetical protein AK812_SmicGene29268 [Symbiodinium microadriaticum]|uniref:Uncharacterized protein n=1 Tax=Symbiodinium microadriaticum TaxID=2951 RepID=A0A1Q9D297_SYMMI|nr:hypothetical protein AK812_SmicGene29268 [Symbiodinium microadriaticum]